MNHDQNFKNLILDYPRQALEFFAATEASPLEWETARITPVRQEQVQERLGERFLACDLYRLPAAQYLHSSNRVARLNLVNMAYAPEQRLEVYRNPIRVVERGKIPPPLTRLPPFAKGGLGGISDRARPQLI